MGTFGNFEFTNKRTSVGAPIKQNPNEASVLFSTGGFRLSAAAWAETCGGIPSRVAYGVDRKRRVLVVIGAENDQAASGFLQEGLNLVEPVKQTGLVRRKEFNLSSDTYILVEGVDTSNGYLEVDIGDVLDAEEPEATAAAPKGRARG